jgi:beta-N-acetylhexosaminidase
MTRAFICGLGGLEITKEERSFLKDAQPWGVILFKRNVESRQQLLALTSDIRDALGFGEAPVLVDQEGGRVQRLGPPHWRAYPAAAVYERAGANDAARERLAWLGGRLIAHDLREVGITIDCMPVLDVPSDGSHNIIGDRAYSRDPGKVARFGGAAARGLLAGGVAPVIKHMPGHGRARADSHHDLPFIDAARAELEAADFRPFAANVDTPIGMTAHVVYSAIDPSAPGTLSRTIVQDVIRGLIGFDGLLLTDDLSMKALSGSFRSRAERAVAAGCDVVLHCNGDLGEARAVAEGVPELAGRAAERAGAALARTRAIEDFDPVDGAREFDATLAMVA